MHILNWHLLSNLMRSLQVSSLERLLAHHPSPDGPSQLVMTLLPRDTELVPVSLILLVKSHWVRGGGPLAD